MPFPSPWMARRALVGLVSILAACSGDDAVSDGDGGGDSGSAQDGGGSGAGGGGTGGDRDGGDGGKGGSSSTGDGGGVSGTGGSGSGGGGGSGVSGTGGGGSGTGGGGTGGTGGSGSGDDAEDDSVCNGEDGDGDGEVDEGYDVTTTDCGQGACERTGELKCVGGDEVDSCKAGTPGSSDASCNGEDDDCDGDTDEAYVPVDCDGEDDDECEEGETFCDGGEVLCGDDSSDTKDVCNDLDDDCDSASADGSEDPMDGDACDGTDGDLCDEGTLSCLGGDLVCGDDSSNDLDVCNGEDDDCDALTDDGDEDPQLDDACDGATDTDLCMEGTYFCGVSATALSCSDATSSTTDVCDGDDNDCDASSDDGEEDPGLGAACDSAADSDLCEDGTRVCSGASGLTCNDTTPHKLDVCDGLDNDCDSASDDGDEDPLNGAGCDGTDADECNEGTWSCVSTDLACSDPNDVDLDVDCGGDDEDCDGTNDEGYVADDSCGVGYCHTTNAQSTCVLGAETACQPGAPRPSDATCDGVDDDCSGAPDEDYVNQSCGLGACLAGSTPSSCDLGVETGCVPGAQTGVSETLCNGVDDDCDGDTDENYAITCSGDLSGTLDCVDGNEVSTACDPSPADCLVYTCNIATVTCESTPNDALCAPDGFGCTTAACVITGDIGVCTQVPDDQYCQAQDGDACNGLETCEPGQGCVGGTPPCSDDDFSCTDTACTPLPGGGVMCSQQAFNSRCDNLLHCDGLETCNPASPTRNLAGCVAGPVCPGVEDGASCTEVTCDEGTDSCTNAPIPGACTDSNNCTDDVCAPGTGGANPVTGCKFPAKDCSGAFPPHECATSVCRTTDGACVLDLDDSQCIFPQTCTLVGGCASCTDDAACGDGDPCNGIETCSGGSCQAGTPVTCADDGNSCTIEQCNSGSGQCETVLDHDSCDDGVCNGADSCAPGAGADPGTGCAHGAPLLCDDGAACTDDSCDQVLGCLHNDNGLCEASDTTVCNGAATCQPTDPGNDANGCVEPFPNGIQCEQDGLACTVAECVEPTGCREVPDNSVCNCGEVCVPGTGCDATCVPATCNGKTYACGDCTDNDNDCVTDPNDPNSGIDTGSDLNCLGPCQDNEAGLAGLIPGQNNAPCKMDCYFDADSGSGNDNCEWDHQCDPNLPGDQVKCDTYDDVTLIGGSPKVYCWGGASGTGDSFQSAGGGFIRLVDAAGLFVAGDAGLRIVILGATSPANDGTFLISSYISATTIELANPNGVNQAFTGTWNIAEANSGFENQPPACYDLLDLRDNQTGLCCDARESGAAVGSCTNGTDNDGDSLIDDADPDCNVCQPVPSCDGEDDTAGGYCGPLVPNGCDCFGCCLIPGMNYPIYLGSTQLNGDQLCTLDTLGDPTKCRECVQVPGCLNTCATCEICVGKTTLPPECGECQVCSPGVQLCGGPCGTSCDPGFYCNTGCCTPVPQ